MRLIDADALKEDIEQQCALLRLMKDNEELTQISMVLESGFIAQIDKMPTIEERKKGKWISLDDFRGKYNTYGYKCSECGEHSEYEEKYCPNCGADMRGESNETD